MITQQKLFMKTMRNCSIVLRSLAFGMTLLMGGQVQVLAQDSNLEASIDDLEQLTGISETDVKKAAIDDNTFPTDDKNKIFFLYNVKTGLLLNAGGYWGSHVSLKEYGMPLWIHLDSEGWIHLAQDFDRSNGEGAYGEGDYLEYETSGDADVDKGVYVDRTYQNNNTIVKRGWQLEEVSGKPNTYKLYTYLNNSSSSTTTADFGTIKYYLIAAQKQGDVDMNCGGVIEGSSDITEGSDEWRFISYQQIYELQDKKTEKIVNSLDLTFCLQCPGFSRENAALKNWKPYKYNGNGKIRFGLEHYYKTTSSQGVIGSYTDDFGAGTIKSYTFPDGTDSRTFTTLQEYERYCGKYFCADIKNAHGAIYQDIVVTHGGAYVVECKAFSTTTKAKLFAVLRDTEKGEDVPNTLHITVVGQTSYMSDAEKTALHIEEQNMDYAAKEFYGSHKYTNSVLVQVPEGGGTIRFGIEVGSQDGEEPKDDDKEWTVFDDFRLLYASKTTDADLILDEDRANLDYLKNCSNNYKSVTLHLNKKFDKDKWNGFVLPVSLTKDQLTQAFGPNVKLAELSKLTKNEIQFTSVDIQSKGNNEKTLLAYHPYIIFPTKYLEGEQTPVYTALLSSTGNSEGKDVHIIIKKNHIDIPNVTFDIDTKTNANDLTNMNTDNWTTNMSKTVSGDGTMTAYGTFARTFGEGEQNTNSKSDDCGVWNISNKSQIISGRSDLKGCYFFANGNMYYSATRPRGLRGFSVWFAPSNSTNPTTNAKFFLDGISMDETTGIKQLTYSEDKATVEKYANGIYSLNGQCIRKNSLSTEGLPNGIYIVNGKKVIVK